MSIEVHGSNDKWSFQFYGDTVHLDDWRNDGLNIDIIENVIPSWIVYFGLANVYVMLQDLFNFKNPLR